VTLVLSSIKLSEKLMLVPVIILALLSFSRGWYFKNNLVFSEQWVNTSPDYYLPYYNLGRSQVELEEWNKALESYQKSIDLDPSFAPSYLNLGTVYLQQTELEKAHQNFQTYKLLDPESPSGYYHSGLVYLYADDPQLAIQEFERAIEIDPG